MPNFVLQRLPDPHIKGLLNVLVILREAPSKDNEINQLTYRTLCHKFQGLDSLRKQHSRLY